MNLACSILGMSERVDDPDGTSHVPKTFRAFWPAARDLTLRDFPWACAKKVRVLALRDQDVPGWQYTYDYPNDCLLALAVMPETGLRMRTVWQDVWENHCHHRPQRWPFDRMLNAAGTGQVIVTDLPEAHLMYIARVENPAAYDVGLVMTAAAKLAFLSAATFKVKPEFVRLAAETYELERAKATANDLNEGYPDEEPETPSIAARM